MSLKYNPVRFDEEIHRKIVEPEINSGREISALFLVHGCIEAYLLQWLFVLGGKTKKQVFTDKMVENIERIGLNNLSHAHLILGTIKKPLYKKLIELNRLRNDYAHKIIDKDVTSKKTRREIKRKVSFGLKICDEIFILFKKTLDDRSLGIGELKAESGSATFKKGDYIFSTTSTKFEKIPYIDK